VFVVVVCLHLAFDRFIIKELDSLSGAWGMTAGGVLLGQCFLLGLWAALGGLSALARWSAVGAVLSIGIVALATSFRHSPTTFAEYLLPAAIIGTLFVTTIAVSLLPLRGLAGCRVDFSLDYYRDTRLRQGQVGLMDYAGYTCAFAGLLAAYRLFAELSGGEDISIFAALVGILALAAPFLAFLVLVWRRLWAIGLAAIAWTLLTAQLHSWLELAFPASQFAGGAAISPTRLSSGLIWHYSGVALVVLTLGILRLCGLQLLTLRALQHNREAC
jgi:hypothetical protein